jgi:uncharacterized protein (DUF983 family)
MKKGSKITSIVQGTCPVCQSAHVFESRNPYNKMFAMPTHCKHCNNKYEIEPGYWFGAMYVSYGFTVAISVAAFLLVYFVYPAAGVWSFIVAISILNLVLAPVSFRYSRLVWMNMFQKFEESKAA